MSGAGSINHTLEMALEMYALSKYIGQSILLMHMTQCRPYAFDCKTSFHRKIFQLTIDVYGRISERNSGFVYFPMQFSFFMKLQYCTNHSITNNNMAYKDPPIPVRYTYSYAAREREEVVR